MTDAAAIPAQSAPQHSRTLSWFGTTLRAHLGALAELMLLGICVRLIALVEPFIFQVVIDRILPFERVQSLYAVVVVFVGVSIFELLFQLLAGLLAVRLANQMVRDLGVRIFDHLFRLPLSFFRRYPVGETLSRIQETETVRAFLLDTVRDAVLDLIFLFVYFAILFALSPALALIVLVALPAQFALHLVFGPMMRGRMQRQFGRYARHSAGVVQALGGITDVKATVAETSIVARISRSLTATLNAAYRVEVLGIFNEQAVFLIGRAVTIGIILVGANEVLEGRITLGGLVAFYLIADRVSQPIENFANVWESWLQLRVSCDRLGDIVGAEAEISGQGRMPRPTAPDMCFDRVSFSYASGPEILRHVSARIPPRALTLVTGASGVGKSTFGRLAAGLEAPVSGRISLGGRDLARFDAQDVRRHIAYVPQQPCFFSGTLEEEIRGAHMDASQAELHHALDVSVLSRSLEEGVLALDRSVGEGGSALSGGQKARAALARALLSKPDVLVLDEPTSGLDRDSERDMADNLAVLARDKTVIVITHRPEVFAGAANEVRIVEPKLQVGPHDR